MFHFTVISKIQRHRTNPILLLIQICWVLSSQFLLEYQTICDDFNMPHPHSFFFLFYVDQQLFMPHNSLVFGVAITFQRNRIRIHLFLCENVAIENQRWRSMFTFSDAGRYRYAMQNPHASTMLFVYLYLHPLPYT